MARFDLTKKEDVEKISKRIRRAFELRAKGLGDPEDCVQEILCGMLEGKHQHQTIDQAVIDYLRAKFGDKRLGSYTARKHLTHADSLGPGDVERLLPVDLGRSVANGVDFERMLRVYGQVDKACFKLFYGWGLNAAEVGNLFGFSESRVCQRLARVSSGISARVKAQEGAGLPGERAGQMACILRPEAERKLWGVGEITFERMETGESFGVESFNEKSF